MHRATARPADPEDTQQNAALDSESSTDEAAADVDEEQWVEAATADYQARLREFENVESAPVVSLPGDLSQPGEGDLEVQPPSDPSG